MTGRTAGPTAGLLTGVDRGLFAAAVVGQLRAVGLGTAVASAERLARSLEAAGPMTRADLYWVLRVSSLQGHDDLERFDAWFEAVFGSDPLPSAPGRGADTPTAGGDTSVPVRRLVDGQAVHGGLPWATSTPTASPADDGHDTGDPATPLAERLPSVEIDVDAVPFDLLDPEQLAAVGERLAELFDRWPTRPSRRRRTAVGGTVDLRRTMATARRTGGETLVLHRRRPVRRPRRVAALLDVSGSMESYATAYLHLLRVLARHHRAEELDLPRRPSPDHGQPRRVGRRSVARRSRGGAGRRAAAPPLSGTRPVRSPRSVSRACRGSRAQLVSSAIATAAAHGATLNSPASSASRIASGSRTTTS